MKNEIIVNGTKLSDEQSHLVGCLISTALMGMCVQLTKEQELILEKVLNELC